MIRKMWIRGLICTVVVLAGAATSGAQMSVAEAQARLNEKARQPATPAAPAAKKPATPPAKHQYWAAKKTAPECVRSFVAMLPELKQSAVRDVDGQIAQMKAKRDQIAREPDKVIDAGSTLHFGRLTQSDPDDALQKARRHRECDQEIQGLYATKKAILADDLWLPPAVHIRWSVGEFGNLPSAHVVQVINDHEVLARYGEVYFWFSGLNTKNIVDGQDYAFGESVLVKGTKRYTTVLNVESTVFEVSPFDIHDDIEPHDAV